MRPELLAPAGPPEIPEAVIAAGADAFTAISSHLINMDWTPLSYRIMAYFNL